MFRERWPTWICIFSTVALVFIIWMGTHLSRVAMSTIFGRFAVRVESPKMCCHMIVWVRFFLVKKTIFIIRTSMITQSINLMEFPKTNFLFNCSKILHFIYHKNSNCNELIIKARTCVNEDRRSLNVWFESFLQPIAVIENVCKQMRWYRIVDVRWIIRPCQ